MRFKLTLERPGSGAGTDLLIEADGATTIGFLADTLAERDPDGSAGAGLHLPTIRAEGASDERTLGRDRPLSDAQLRSGDRISLVDSEGRFVAASDDRAAAATLVVTSGPMVGTRFGLRRGASQVGRDPACEVHLEDRRVSKRHARINVTDTVEVIDLVSANGVQVNGQRVARAVLRPGDQLVLGQTTMVVEDLRRLASEVTGPTESFNRSPYLDPRYPEQKVEPPAPPSPPPTPRLPLIALLAPLVMGVVLYTITRQLLSVVFIGLSPLLMAGNYLEGRRTAKATIRTGTEAFRSELESFCADLDRAHAAEIARRRLEHPSSAQVLTAAQARAPMLWARRPDRVGFLSVRLGLASLPSRTTIDVPRPTPAIPGLREELLEALAPRREVADVPVAVALPDVGALGLAGKADDARASARSVLVQIAGLHSPDEVAVAAIVGPEAASHWDWLTWLPHATPDRHVVPGLLWAGDGPSGRALASALRAVIDERTGGDGTDGPAIVVLIEDGAPVERSLLVELVERGPAARVHVVWVAATLGRVPAGCTVYLDHDPATHQAAAGLVQEGRAVTPVSVEAVDGRAALAFARDLAPVVDAGARGDEEGDLPAGVALVEHIGLDFLTSIDAVVERWTLSDSMPGTGRPRRRREGNPLHAVVGSAAHEPLQIDLRAHGPHALVGGTTGSGKSEFLQSWVASLAVTHSPARVTFLFIDYKGGSAFGDCVTLPHSVGLVTDLTPHLVNRALRSLRAEVTHREELLRAKAAKDMIDLEAAGDPDALPSLIIVVDEFAALIGEVPEFVDGVVDVAQRGRSLGLHLVLATQRPAGAIRENLRANTNLRVALRMAEVADSVDVVGSEQAAHFDPGVPGRAVAKLGPGRVTPFQSAYVGGWSEAEPPPPQVDIRPLGIEGAEPWLAPEPEETEATTATAPAGPKDLALLVGTAKRAFEHLEMAEPRPPWLPALEATYDMARNPKDEHDLRLLSRRDDELVYGVLDDPDKQEQRTVAFRPDHHGNMVVIGTGGSGKSALLRTLALAGTLATRGGPCHVYGLDFASHALDVLEELPTVGAIVSGEDEERVARLVRTLHETVEERLARYAEVRADTITQYRTAAGRPDEPRILLLIDGYAAFRQAYETGGTDRMRVSEELLAIATNGRQAGVHVVVAVDRVGALPAAMAAVIQHRLVLRLAGEAEYSLLGVPPSAFPVGTPPGRGFVGEHEVQVTVLGGTANTAVQGAMIHRLAEAVGERGWSPAAPVRRLPTEIPLASLPTGDGGDPIVGIEDSGLQPYALALDAPLLVAGPARSGRSTLMATILHGLARAGRQVDAVYIGEGASPLHGGCPWAVELRPGPDLATEIAAVTEQLATADAGSIAVVIDDLARVASWAEAGAVLTLFETASRRGHVVLGDGDPAALTSTYGIVHAIKSTRHGVVLMPDPYDGENLLKTPLPKIRRKDFPPGRGFHLRNGVARKVHFASVWEEGT